MQATLKATNFLNLISKHLPDMLWAKDLEGNYLYANEAVCNNLLMATTDEILGKNDLFFANREKEKYPENDNWHTFGESCSDSDYLILRNMKPMIFKEYGNIRGEKVYFEVHKAPLHDISGKLIGTIGSGRNITAQVLLKKENEKLQYYDQLTNLANRQKFNLDITTKNPTACIIFNIDQFKEINNFFRTENGDQILKEVASWFSKLGLEIYRIGGDEFGLLYYENIPLEIIERNVKNILSLFDRELFYIQKEKVQINFSVGIAKENERLFTKAEIAVHNAKENKLKIAIYKEDDNIEQKYKHNIAMATSIREALIDSRIICYYQPIMNIKTGKITKYETLVRMIKKDGEIASPFEFLEISKKTKLYPHITIEVITQACNFFKNKKENFSINLSIDDMKDSYTVKEIISILIKTNTASRVVFEILESEGIENYDEVSNFITQIKALGSKIAIDDFGTGYSNFEHILKLDVDFIKIDGSLIKGMKHNDKYRIIVETIVDFAKKIGSKTIAEFVSDDNIFSISEKIGIDFAQGFYIGEPSSLNICDI